MSEKFVDEPKAMLRMCDLTSEPKRMLPPIRGYEKEPLVSLEEAVQPLLSAIPDVEQMVWTVKQNCQHPLDDLSSDESASIMLYTLEWMPRESSLYFILNQTLRSQNRYDLVPWFLFLRLFMYALSKLPSTTRRMVYRGTKMDLGEKFPKDKTLIWWAFSSCSSSIEVLEQFLGQSGHRTIFNIECDSPRDISQHSFYPSENEMLLYPARHFQVVSSFNPSNQLKIIHLKEIQPPFSLIHIPTTISTKNDPIERIETPLTNSYQNKQLQQLIRQYRQQSEIDLNKQNLNDEDMEIVVQEAIIHKKCKELNLKYNKITSMGVTIIAKALNNNTTLKQLNLRGNRLYDTAIQSLAKILSRNNSKLSDLDLQSTGITDEGAWYLAEMLKTNTTLEFLRLGDNDISDRGVEHLTKALTSHNATLLSLRVDRNKLMSDLSIDFLVDMLKHNQTLKILDIEQCSLSEERKMKLQEYAESKRDFELVL